MTLLRLLSKLTCELFGAERLCSAPLLTTREIFGVRFREELWQTLLTDVAANDPKRTFLRTRIDKMVI